MDKGRCSTGAIESTESWFAVLHTNYTIPRTCTRVDIVDKTAATSVFTRLNQILKVARPLTGEEIVNS